MTRLLLLPVLLAPALGWASAGLSTCGDPATLERKADKGKLDAEQIDCLEGLYGDAVELDKFRISEMLLADGAAKGDLQGWSTRAARHLDELDPKNAPLALQYAKTLMSNRERADEAIAWAEVAIAHAYRFHEDEVGIKLLEAYRVRTRAAKVKWDFAEAAFGVDQDPKLRMEAAVARSKVRLYAVEWMKHALSIDMSTAEARTWCTQTGWTEADCDEAAAR